jgi:uncharacterized protein YvpB
LQETNQLAKKVEGIDLTGKDFDLLLQEMRKRNTPIVCWCTLDLREPHLTDTWEDYKTGSKITWTSPEHCLLLIGFDDEYVFVSDPHTGKMDKHPRELFKKRYEQMGSQAVTISIQDKD